MQQRLVLLTGIILTLIVSFWPRGARAGSIGSIEVTPEVWIGGGVSWPVYHDHSEACGRGGFGAEFAQHFTLGISGQVDRDHFHYFIDGGVALPQVWFVIPYGRYQFGRREDRGDNAWGYCAGMRLLGEGMNFYVEFSEILEPEYNKAMTLGLQF